MATALPHRWLQHRAVGSTDDTGGVRARAAAGLARSVGQLSRTLRAGAGTTLPGRIVDRLDPRFVRRRSAALAGKAIVISGTNGKTTTASMIQTILRSQGVRFVANRSGANLRSGIASALLEASPDALVGVFEIDEAALPGLVPDLRPGLLVLTNVFRDQLDRFAEPERVAALLRAAARALPSDSTIVANADDAQLWHALKGLDPVGFSVEADHEDEAAAADAEPETCPECGGPLRFSRRTMANLGSARCDACGWRSSPAQFRARLLAQAGLQAQIIEIEGELLTLPLGGLHDAYNAVAAVAAASALGIPVYEAISALEDFHPRFGRAEELEFEGRSLWLALAKNPAGAGAVIREVCADERVGAVIAAISDRHADGRDVSWIWDADFEHVVERGIPIVPAGSRALDTAVRIKYAGAEPLPAESDPAAALRAAVNACEPGKIVAVLATYTAMLDLREVVVGNRAGRVEDDAT